MDVQHPITRIVHEPITGEHLERERIAANRPFPFTPHESFWIVAVTLAALVAVVVSL